MHFIGRLGGRSGPTAIASSASNHFPFFWEGSCICQTWKGSTRGEFWSSEDGQNIIIHPMYSFNNVYALSLDVWVPDHVLQPSPQAHSIISHFSGRGSCICQTWKGSPQGKFWSSEDGQNIIMHPMYSSDNVYVLSLDVWGPDHVLQPSPQAHLIISHFSGWGSCICQSWKGSTRGEFWSSEDGQNIILHPMYSSNNVDALSLDVWVPDHVLQPSPQAHLIISHFSGRGAAFVKPGKGRPEVSSGPLRTVKIS
jgi:hypothetical protein